MTREEIDAAVPLVLQHYDALVRRMDARRTAMSDRRKVSRRSVIDAYLETRNAPLVAKSHGVSPALVGAILAEAVVTVRKIAKVAPPATRVPPLVLADPPAHLIADIDEWAAVRHMPREKAARELIRIGLDVTSARVERQVEAALAAIRQVQTRHPRKAAIRS